MSTSIVPILAYQLFLINALNISDVHTVFPQINSCQNFMEKHLEKLSLFCEKGLCEKSGISSVASFLDAIDLHVPL